MDHSMGDEIDAGVIIQLGMKLWKAGGRECPTSENVRRVDSESNWVECPCNDFLGVQI